MELDNANTRIRCKIEGTSINSMAPTAEWIRKQVKDWLDHNLPEGAFGEEVQCELQKSSYSAGHFLRMTAFFFV